MKNKKIILIGVLALGVPLAVALVVGNQGFLDLYKSHRELNARSRQIQEAKAVRDSLLVEKEKLLQDTSYLEKLAREKLGMARKDEKIFKFVEENKQ